MFRSESRSIGETYASEADGECSHSFRIYEFAKLGEFDCMRHSICYNCNADVEQVYGELHNGIFTDRSDN